MPTPFVLWLEWQHYYAADSPVPQAVMRQNTVFDMNMAAWLAGIVKGMRKHQVKPLAPDCTYSQWAPNTEKAEGWLNLCTPFSGCVEPIDEHIAALDLSDHPHPLDIAELCVNCLQSESLGRLSYGIGSSKWLARLRASQGYGLKPMPDSEKFLAGLPVAKLPIEIEHSQRLEFLGYHTIGEVARLPLGVLLAQFDPTAHVIHLAARGELRDDVRALYPPNIIREPFFFANPVNEVETLQKAIDLVAIKLASRMTGLQASAIDLLIEFEESPAIRRTRDFKRPIIDLAGIRAALRYLSTFETELSSGITRFSVDLGGLEPIRSQQKVLFLARDKPKPDAFIGSLQSAFGDQIIVSAAAIKVKRREQVLKEWRNATGWS